MAIAVSNRVTRSGGNRYDGERNVANTKNKRQSGFTLIELLIVVAIIGIIAAILIPNMIDSLQKAKQRRTMTDVSYMGKAIMAWLTDEVGAAAAGASVRNVDISQYSSALTGDELEERLVPQYIPAIPDADGWGGEYEYFINDEGLATTRVMLIRSSGRDRAFAGNSYEISSYTMTDYDQDIVWADGLFIRWPGKN